MISYSVVRDIVAVLDRKVALSLNSFLDHTTLTNLIPVVAIGDGLAEHARTLEISKQLGDALNEYGMRAKEKKHQRRRSSTTSSINKGYVMVQEEEKKNDNDDNKEHENNNVIKVRSNSD